MARRERSGRSSSSRKSSRGNSRSTGKSKKTFQYKKRNIESVKKRSTQGAGNRDQVFKDEFKVFKVTEDNNIRILPPTWDDPEHYALDIYIHYGIGPDESAFLCLDKVDSDDDCPICEERTKAEAEGDSDYASSLKPTKRPTCFVIDRDNEDDGPQLWAMPWTVDRDLSAQSFDKRTGEVIPLDDPYDGYDVSFSRQGKGMKTKYVGLSIGRHSSEASDDLDTVLEYVQDNPVTETLDIKDADYISSVFAGHNAKSADKNEKKGRGDRTDSTNPDIDLNWEDVHDMSFSELEDLVEDEELDDTIDPEDFDEEDELADAICEELGIDKPRSSSRDKTKARNMRNKKRR